MTAAAARDRAAALLVAVGLAACASPPRHEPVAARSLPAALPAASVETRDGPDAAPPPSPAQWPDALPTGEPAGTGAPAEPAETPGRASVPVLRDTPFRQRGIASWYGRKFHGRRTASGEIYDMHAMTAAHPTLPLPSYVRVRNLANSAEVVLRVNDRGPFHRGRIIDLSHGAALKLGVLNGVAAVELERITFDEARELVPRVREGLERVPRVPRRR